METKRLRGAFATDAGMFALWDPAHFSSVRDYESWEQELFEDADIQRHIASGALVPINIGSDGAFEFEVRVGDAASPARLTERERLHLAVSSQSYLFRSEHLCLSGIEAIEARPGALVGQLPLPIGAYAVTIHMIAWDREPGAKDASGQPTADALPDFVILLSPADEQATAFRQRIETFDRPR